MSKKTRPQLDDIERDESAADADIELDGDADDATDSANDADGDAKPASSGKRAAKSGSTKSGSTKSRDKTRPTGKSKASQSTFLSGGGGKRPAGRSGGSGRRPVTPVKVAADRPWGTIALFTIVALIFVGIVGYTGYLAWYNDKSPQEQANLISGISDYTDSKDPKMLSRNHTQGAQDVTYPLSPPVGGDHNETWQNCMGDVYDGPIADEHAVHSLEHGAIWITYRPDLPKQQIDELTAKVEGKDYMMLSPYPGLDSPISVQAWGFQLKVDDAGDSRIDDFVTALRSEGPEKGASCSGGVTVTGDKPREVAPPQGPGGGIPGAPPGGGAPGAPAPAPGG